MIEFFVGEKFLAAKNNEVVLKMRQINIGIR